MNCISPLSSGYTFNQLLLRNKVIRTGFLFQIPYSGTGFISVTLSSGEEGRRSGKHRMGKSHVAFLQQVGNKVLDSNV